MELEKFIANFAEQFEETDENEFTSNTEFKELDEWSSLMALAIIAMIDEEYDISLDGDDIRSSKTIGDLFNLVKSRKNA